MENKIIKVCSICKKEFPISNFRLRRGKPRTDCKICQDTRIKEWVNENRDRVNENHRNWRARNKAITKRWWKHKNLIKKYGITLEQYDEMYTSQGGKCKICKDVYEVLYVDHNHSTNKVRGLLCNKCNSAIGFLGEKEENFISAMEYLRSYDD